MTDLSLNVFDREVDCIYDGEKYSVRDNGAVLRHVRSGKRIRPTDNQWTFGKPCSQKGYLQIAGIVIHRIVATAFYGEPPTKAHVVDHIDTNRQNNRPENLRWLTRLENALLNPITLKRIEFIYGSVEAFLEDPSKIGKYDLERNFEWMRTVSLEEAKACKERMDLWAKSDKIPSGGFLGEWVYKPTVIPNAAPETWVYKPVRSNGAPETSVSFTDFEIAKTSSETPCASSTFTAFSYHPQEELITNYESDLVVSLTPGAVQRKWHTPTEFPCCPQSTEEDPIKVYAEKLVPDAIFARNQFSTSVVLESAIIDDGQSLLVMNQKAESDVMKPWTLAKVTYEDGLYVHTSCGTFFMQDGAEKQFCLARGLEWTGGDTFDEFC